MGFDKRALVTGNGACGEVLCNICDRQVSTHMFELHSDLCSNINRAELVVMQCNDDLLEL